MTTGIETLTTPGTLDGLHARLEALDPSNKGVYYALTQKNRIAEIVATPRIFGLPASHLPEGHSKALTDALFDIISNAASSVDVLTLGTRLPGGGFKAKLKDALKKLAESNRAVTVRIAFGQPPPPYAVRLDTLGFLKEITQNLGGTGQNLKVYVAQFNARNNLFKSWNHGKIIAADASAALIGGHNLFDGAYLSATAPVFDLSLKVEGPVAGSAQAFADRVWAFIKRNNQHDNPNWHTFSHSFDAATSTYGVLAADPFSLTAPAGSGTLPILAVANPGYNLSNPDGRDASREAILYFLEKAQRTICISQQDVMNWPIPGSKRPPAIWDAEILSRLAHFIVKRGGRVMIVISSPDAVAEDGDSYSHNIALTDLYKELHSSCAGLSPITPDNEMAKLLKERIFISTIRFNETDRQWPNGRQFANHAKFWMIDERVFYVGSHNWYPLLSTFATGGSLQEYGLIIDDASEASKMIEQYWSPLMRYSSLAAVSGIEWGVPAEQTAPLPWKSGVWVDRSRRTGEAFRDSAEQGRTYLTMLSATGSMLIHSAPAALDPTWTADIRWRREATANASPYNEDRFFRSAGPVIQHPGSAFALDDKGYVQQCYNYDGAWHLHRFDRPESYGHAVRLLQLGPMLYDDGSSWPFRFFAVDDNDGLWDCYWAQQTNVWAWQAHEKPDPAVAQLGPIVNQPGAAHPLKMFYLDRSGNVVQRRFNASSRWSTTSHGAPAGLKVTSIGPMLFDAKPEFLPSQLQIFAIGNDHQLYALHVQSNGAAEWKAQPKLGFDITQLGPTFLVGLRSTYPGKIFVLTRNGEMWEHCWNRERGWDWVGHGNPGKAIAGIGPRTGSERAIIHPVRIFVTTTDGWTYERRWGLKGWEWQRHIATT